MYYAIALCLMLSITYNAQNYAGIKGLGLTVNPPVCEFPCL